VFEVLCEGTRSVYATQCAELDPECGEVVFCDHSIVMWDDFGDGWNGGYIDVYVNGELVLSGVTLATGSGPATVTFEGIMPLPIETVWTAGGWPYEASYCIYNNIEVELGCDGLGGVDPVGITVTGDCAAPPECGDGVCEPPLETCITCPEDCGECGCPEQPKNEQNGLFSDLNCDFCGTGVQVIADNFLLTADQTVQSIEFWGGYYPDNLPSDPDQFYVLFLADDGGAPGDPVWSIGPVAATTKSTTGVVLFGVDEYVYTIDLGADLVAGTYWIELYTDTSDTTDSWFWETGNLDPVVGIAGSAWTPESPDPATWNLDPATELSFILTCGVGEMCGDIDGDGVVDHMDYDILRDAMGTCTGDAGYIPTADMDGSGCINFIDFQMWYACCMDWCDL